jgi:hypothetical protein
MRSWIRFLKKIKNIKNRDNAKGGGGVWRMQNCAVNQRPEQRRVGVANQRKTQNEKFKTRPEALILVPMLRSWPEGAQLMR